MCLTSRSAYFLVPTTPLAFSRLTWKQRKTTTSTMYYTLVTTFMSTMAKVTQLSTPRKLAGPMRLITTPSFILSLTIATAMRYIVRMKACCRYIKISHLLLCGMIMKLLTTPTKTVLRITKRMKEIFMPVVQRPYKLIMSGYPFAHLLAPSA